MTTDWNHPRTRRRFADTYENWLFLRADHTTEQAAHWLGMITDALKRTIRWVERDPQQPQRQGPLRGTDHPFARLTEQAVHDIRAAPPHHGLIRALARKYYVSERTVLRARRGETWKHIT